MRDRLIELIAKSNLVLVDGGIHPYTHQAQEALADHLLANGVIVPPCKVGDTVWFETYENNGRDCVGVQPHIVYKTYYVAVVGEGKCVHTELYDWCFGKTVFLTKEEAEKALAERREG